MSGGFCEQAQNSTAKDTRQVKAFAESTAEHKNFATGRLFSLRTLSSSPRSHGYYAIAAEGRFNIAPQGTGKVESEHEHRNSE